MISEWSTGKKKGSCLEIIIYTINHGPQEEGENMKKSLYTEAGNSYNKSKHTAGQSGSQMNTCNSDGNSERICLE